ncbi:MAG: radical SAM protein [Clostridia bacterium]|nr:radical SAM protein [Clostridia bacterium]
MRCMICPRACGADRETGAGVCGVGAGYRVARAALHFWEEPCISGARGSGTVFFSGCNLGCVFCQNYEVSHAALGAPVDEDALLRLFDRLIAHGAHNLNLVTPSHYAPMLAKSLARFHSPVPVVWNTSAYERVETLRLLEGLVDIYLPDLKYYDAAPAQKYSGAADYFPVAAAAVAEMHRQVGTLTLDENGLARRGVLIRHLVLPGNVSQAEKVFAWVRETLGPETAVSLMRQYTPYGKAKTMPPLDRPLTDREYAIAKRRVRDLGFENCYFQRKDAASENFIPTFSAESVDF